MHTTVHGARCTELEGEGEEGEGEGEGRERDPLADRSAVAPLAPSSRSSRRSRRSELAFISPRSASSRSKLAFHVGLATFSITLSTERAHATAAGSALGAAIQLSPCCSIYSEE